MLRQRIGQAAALRLHLDRLLAGVDAGRHDRHAHHAVHRFIKRRAHDDVRVGVDFLADAVGRFVQFEQRQVGTAGDVDEHALGPAQADLVQQRVGDRLLGGLNGAVVARGLARTHHGLAHLVHDRAHVCEVEVDQAGLDHQVGHALDALVKDVVGHGEGFGESGLFVGQSEQVLVRNDDERIDDLLERLDPLVGLAHALGALELERLGHDADGQHTQFTRGLRDDRRGTGARAAAHAGGDEAHVRAGKVIDDFLDGFLGSRSTDCRARTGTQTFGHLHAHLDAGLGIALLKGLRVGVRHHELDTVEHLLDHVVDRVAARAAHAEHGNPRLKFFPVAHLQIQCHLVVPPVFPSAVPAFSPLCRNLPSTLGKVTKKTPPRHKIWGVFRRLKRHFANVSGCCAYQLSLNHFMARRSDLAG